VFAERGHNRAATDARVAARVAVTARGQPRRSRAPPAVRSGGRPPAGRTGTPRYFWPASPCSQTAKSPGSRPKSTFARGCSTRCATASRLSTWSGRPWGRAALAGGTVRTGGGGCARATVPAPAPRAPPARVAPRELAVPPATGRGATPCRRGSYRGGRRAARAHRPRGGSAGRRSSLGHGHRSGPRGRHHRSGHHWRGRGSRHRGPSGRSCSRGRDRYRPHSRGDGAFRSHGRGRGRGRDD